jgi:hypothetical protein
MYEFPTDRALTRVGLTRRDFLAPYVDSQRKRVCEPIQRFGVNGDKRAFIGTNPTAALPSSFLVIADSTDTSRSIS